jgi:hypothetical protein
VHRAFPAFTVPSRAQLWRRKHILVLAKRSVPPWCTVGFSGVHGALACPTLEAQAYFGFGEAFFAAVSAAVVYSGLFRRARCPCVTNLGGASIFWFWRSVQCSRGVQWAFPACTVPLRDQHGKCKHIFGFGGAFSAAVVCSGLFRRSRCPCVTNMGSASIFSVLAAR